MESRLIDGVGGRKRHDVGNERNPMMMMVIAEGHNRRLFPGGNSRQSGDSFPNNLEGRTGRRRSDTPIPTPGGIMGAAVCAKKNSLWVRVPLAGKVMLG